MPMCGGMHRRTPQSIQACWLRPGSCMAVPAVVYQEPTLPLLALAAVSGLSSGSSPHAAATCSASVAMRSTRAFTTWVQ
jgi:hypothetical protein